MQYQICIDLTTDVNGSPLEENIPLMSSPLFKTKQQATDWYHSSYFEYENLDIILVVYNEEHQTEDVILLS